MQVIGGTPQKQGKCGVQHNNTVVPKMKTWAAIMFVCFGQFACGEDAFQKPLHARIKEALDSGSAMVFKSGDEARTVSFRDAEEHGLRDVEPIILQISHVISRVAYPDSREVTLDDAEEIYSQYSEAVEKAGSKPELDLWISKLSNDELLAEVIEALCPTGRSTIWIRYVESSPRPIDPRFIHKPVPPTNQNNPAQQGGAGRPATSRESDSEGSEKSQPESEGPPR